MGSFSLLHLIILFVVAVILFAPSIVAFVRNHGQKWLVLLLNVLTGWTGIGWIVAMIWAIMGNSVQPQSNYSETFR